MPRRIVLAIALSVAGCQPDAPADAPPVAEPVAPPVAEAVPPPMTTGTVGAMQGTWRSTDDSLSVMRIEGDRVTELYDGEAMDAPATVRAVADCDGRQSDPAGDAFVFEDGTEDPRCFTMDAVDETSLAYVYSARGNRLAFERVR